MHNVRSQKEKNAHILKNLVSQLGEIYIQTKSLLYIRYGVSQEFDNTMH